MPYKRVPKKNYKKKKQVSKQLATKAYVDKKLKTASYSKQVITTVDLDRTTTVTTGIMLTSNIVGHILQNNCAIFQNGTISVNTDGTTSWKLHIKIDYVKWQIRYALGENETTSAVSQNVREIFFRDDNQYEEINSAGAPAPVVDDLDGNVKYDLLYGNKQGLYSDRFHYLRSNAADSDTTVGGQKMSKGFCKLNYVDTYNAIKPGQSLPLNSDVTSEKGQLCLGVYCDDPTGENAQAYGFVEIGWRYMQN